jgi:hypothetical protein
MPLPALPNDYSLLIEGQLLATGATYPGFVPNLQLLSTPAWQNAFGQHKRFRVVGFAHALAAHGIAFASLKKTDAFMPEVRRLTPPAWIDAYFTKQDWDALRATQLKDAYQGRLQRFDKAVLSLLYLHAVFQQRGIDLPLYKLVHIRPITYFIEGFATVHSLIKSDGVAMKSVGDAAAQVGPDVLNKMAEGLTFVSRKTAEAVLQGLVALDCGADSRMWYRRATHQRPCRLVFERGKDLVRAHRVSLAVRVDKHVRSRTSRCHSTTCASQPVDPGCLNINPSRASSRSK